MKSAFPNHQCGFRHNRSTLNVLLQLEHNVYKGFKEKSVTLVLFLDLSGAFDRASPTCILYKLCLLGLRGNCLHYFQQFFSNREFRVRIENSYSQNYPILSGVPQGSVLSPLLFNILLLDLPQREGIATFCFADDIAYCVTAPTIQEAEGKIQEVANAVTQWAKTWGQILNPQKSKLMCFTWKRINAIPTIILNNSPVTFVTKHCFLGLHLDGPRLTWKHHIEHLLLSYSKRLNVMKRLASATWGASVNILTVFYKSFIRSKLDYGSIIYGSACKTQLHKLDVIQSAALRIITGAFTTSPILSLQIETNLLPLDYWRALQTLTWLMKLQYFSMEHPVFQLFSLDFDKMFGMNWCSGRQIPFLVRSSYLLCPLQVTSASFGV